MCISGTSSGYYMLIAVSKSLASTMISFDLDYAPLKSLTSQAGFFFVTSWICFAVVEILLLIRALDELSIPCCWPHLHSMLLHHAHHISSSHSQVENPNPTISSTNSHLSALLHVFPTPHPKIMTSNRAV